MLALLCGCESNPGSPNKLEVYTFPEIAKWNIYKKYSEKSIFIYNTLLKISKTYYVTYENIDNLYNKYNVYLHKLIDKFESGDELAGFFLEDLDFRHSRIFLKILCTKNNKFACRLVKYYNDEVKITRLKKIAMYECNRNNIFACNFAIEHDLFDKADVSTLTNIFKKYDLIFSIYSLSFKNEKNYSGIFTNEQSYLDFLLDLGTFRFNDPVQQYIDSNPDSLKENPEFLNKLTNTKKGYLYFLNWIGNTHLKLREFTKLYDYFKKTEKSSAYFRYLLSQDGCLLHSFFTTSKSIVLEDYKKNINNNSLKKTFSISEVCNKYLKNDIDCQMYLTVKSKKIEKDCHKIERLKIIMTDGKIPHPQNRKSMNKDRLF